MVLLAAAFDGVVVTMISFSPFSPPGLRERYAEPSQAAGSKEVGAHISLAFDLY